MREDGSGTAGFFGQRLQSPTALRSSVHAGDGTAYERIADAAQPANGIVAVGIVIIGGEIGAERLHKEKFGEFRDYQI